MTDGPVRVWPRQALDAVERGGRWTLDVPDYTDAEFAAHFMPADRLDRLLAAVEAWDASVRANVPTLEHIRGLQAAWRAYDE